MKKNGFLKKLAYSERDHDFYNSFLPEFIKPARERLSTLMGYKPELIYSMEAEMELRPYFDADPMFSQSGYIDVDHRAVTIVRYRESFLLHGEAAADETEPMGLLWADASSS